jgi:hypothetical protein
MQENNIILHWFYLSSQIAYFVIHTVTDQNIDFLLPDLRRAIVRNGDSISTDFTERRFSYIFRQFDCLGLFDIAT